MLTKEQVIAMTKEAGFSEPFIGMFDDWMVKVANTAFRAGAEAMQKKIAQYHPDIRAIDPGSV